MTGIFSETIYIISWKKSFSLNLFWLSKMKKKISCSSKNYLNLNHKAG